MAALIRRKPGPPRTGSGSWGGKPGPPRTGPGSWGGEPDPDIDRDEIPPGTLYLLILKTLAVRGRLHGYEIAESIQNCSDDVLQVEEGSLYPALQRMLIKGWVIAEWGVTSGNRRARYYTLTRDGEKQLGIEMSQFQRVMGAIARIIQTA